MKRWTGVAIITFLSGCAVNYDKYDIDSVTLVNDDSNTHKCLGFELYQTDGFMGLFNENTYEQAVKQAKARALKKGGNCIELARAVRAVDDETIDLTPLLAGFVAATSENKNVKSAMESWANAEVDDEQLFWYFNVGRLVP